jgi:ribosomal protein L37AE/L43A
MKFVCSTCSRPSYTANTLGPWFCPYCGAELEAPSGPAEAGKGDAE